MQKNSSSLLLGYTWGNLKPRIVSLLQVKSSVLNINVENEKQREYTNNAN